MSRSLAGAEPASPSAAEEAVLANLGFAIGMQIRVDGERGTWKLTGLGRDGSLTVVGGPRRQWRSFRPEWCYPARRPGRAGRAIAGRLPKELRGLRRQWRADQLVGSSSGRLATPPSKPSLRA